MEETQCSEKKNDSQKMVAAVLKSRWLTAVDLFSNKNMDHNNVSVSTIERMFYE